LNGNVLNTSEIFEYKRKEVTGGNGMGRTHSMHGRNEKIITAF
jgi:hypothetical protein